MEATLEIHVLAPGEEVVERGLLEGAAPMWRRTSGPWVATSKPATVARPAVGGSSVVSM